MLNQRRSGAFSILFLGLCVAFVNCAHAQQPLARLLASMSSSEPPTLDRLGQDLHVPVSVSRSKTAARLATYLPDSANGQSVAFFSLATAQKLAAAQAFREYSPHGTLVTYFSSLRYDPKYGVADPNNYTMWMDGHEQDFLHAGDPGMLTGVPSGGGCIWTWLPDARVTAAYVVYSRNGRRLATVPSSANPSYRASTREAIYLNDVGAGGERWYTSIGLHGKRVPTECAIANPSVPSFSHVRFTLTPNPHPIFPAEGAATPAYVAIGGSVDNSDSTPPILQWLYRPTASTAPQTAALVGGPPHWRVPSGVGFTSAGAAWHGSPALRYCDARGRCTDWWTSNENNRLSWGRFNSHTYFLDACSPTENADALAMMKRLHGALHNDAFELDDLLAAQSGAWPDVFHTQDAKLPDDAALQYCDQVHWPKYARTSLHALGLLTLVNGGSNISAPQADGRLYEDVPWSAGLGMPYPFTFEKWKQMMQAILDDVHDKKIVWLVPTGDQEASVQGARIRSYSFAVYELLRQFPERDAAGLYYGFSQIDDAVFPATVIDLGVAQKARFNKIDELYDSSTNAYVRRYERGTVYVCPPGVANCTIGSHGARQFFLAFGERPLQADASRTFTPVNGVTLHGGQGAIMTDSPLR